MKLTSRFSHHTVLVEVDFPVPRRVILHSSQSAIPPFVSLLLTHHPQHSIELRTICGLQLLEDRQGKEQVRGLPRKEITRGDKEDMGRKRPREI
eukprot:754693-Hanusia_phi.AAC.4